MALLNKIHNDHTLVLPDIQRDFVWDRDQIRLLLDSLMKGYPFGALLIWETRYLEVAFRDFIVDYTHGQVVVPKTKDAGKPLEMVLDGQQRLQSFLIAVYGSHEGSPHVVPLGLVLGTRGLPYLLPCRRVAGELGSR